MSCANKCKPNDGRSHDNFCLLVPPLSTKATITDSSGACSVPHLNNFGPFGSRSQQTLCYQWNYSEELQSIKHFLVKGGHFEVLAFISRDMELTSAITLVRHTTSKNIGSACDIMLYVRRPTVMLVNMTGLILTCS